MRIVAFTILTALVPLFPQQQNPAPKPAPTQESLLERIYRLVWPLGRYKGRLSDAVARNTEKAGNSAEVPLYLVNTERPEARAATAWTSALTGREPVVCPGAGTLLYRRGNAVYREAIRVRSDGVSSTGAPVEMAGVRAGHLWACTQTADGKLTLWIETMAGELRLARWSGSTASVSEPAEEDGLQLMDPDEFAARLRDFHAIRPDGLAVFVVGGQLIVQRPDGPRVRLLADEYEFSGTPVWVAESPFVFVNATAREGR
jgi:hypothetical protein